MPALAAEARRRGCRTMTGACMFDAQAKILTKALLGREAATVSRNDRHRRIS